MAGLLRDGSEAASSARVALLDGGTGTVWDGSTTSASLAHIYRRRLRLTQRTGQETVGLERAVERLSAHSAPVRLGHITSRDGRWTYLLFLTEDALTLIACTGTRRR